MGSKKCHLCRIIVRIVPGKRKGKGLPSQGHEGPEGVTYIATLSLISALDVGGWSTPRLGRFTPGIVRVSILYEAGWATGPVWTVAEKFDHAGIQSWNRPTRSQSLH